MEVWGEGEEPEREPIKMSREEFSERVMRDAGLPSRRETLWMILAVFAALKEQISPGRRRHGATAEGSEGDLGPNSGTDPGL